MAFSLTAVHEWVRQTFFSDKRNHIESQNQDLVKDIVKRLNECEQRHDEELTARRRLEKTTTRLEETVARMEAERAIAVVECDDNKQIIDWNKGAEKLFRWTKEQVLGKHITILFPPRHWKRSTEMLKQINGGEAADDSTMFGLNREGDTMALRTSLHKYINDDGKPRTVLEITLNRV